VKRWLFLALFFPSVLDAQVLVFGDSSCKNPCFVVDSTEFPKVEPSLPLYDEIYPVPKEYERWYWEIANCEGLRPPPMLFREIRFFYINAIGFGRRIHPQVLLGYTLTEPEYGVFLVLPLIGDANLVKHELLHAILSALGLNKVSHPKPYYDAGRCGMKTVWNP
jgi:hypothetical protein